MKKLSLKNRKDKIRANLYYGGALEVLKTFPDNCIHSIVTDPPYGLSFMGKHWDYEVPSIKIWEECLRVLKPGGYLLAFAGTRTQHRMAVRIEDAGFEIRDMIAWVYGTGFPKSLNISKALNKAVTTKNAQLWEGWGTALKPALEPITVARKPISGTVAANVLKHGVGGLNVDACRIPVNSSIDDPRLGGKGAWKTGKAAKSVYAGGYKGDEVSSSAGGRFPANFIHDGSSEVTAKFPRTQSGSNNIKCASGKSKFGNTGSAYGSESREAGTQMIAYGDIGNASRFFYCAKASKSDRDEGMENFELKHVSGLSARSNEKRVDKSLDVTIDRPRRANNHPTVKPTDLMRYLCRLVTPSNGRVLDPFMGSGSTGKAAIPEGFRFIGIDRELNYCKIAAARIRYALKK